MKRKRLALIVLAVILLSGLTLTFVSAEIVIDGNTPGSAADDNKITSVFTWTGNGKVNVVGSTEGRSYLSSSVSSWTFSLSGVAATIEQAYLYIGTFQYSAASASWTVDLVDPLSGTTNIATGASTRHQRPRACPAQGSRCPGT